MPPRARENTGAFPQTYTTNVKSGVQKEKRHKSRCPGRKRVGEVVNLCPGPCSGGGVLGGTAQKVSRCLPSTKPSAVPAEVP